MLLGMTKDNTRISWDVLDKVNPNNLLLQLGMSGAGKTTSCKNIMKGAIAEGIPTICIDISGSYREKDIRHLGNIDYYNIFTDGLNIDIFSPQINIIEDKHVWESDTHRADRICELIVHALKLKGDAQKFELRCAILNYLSNTTVVHSFEGVMNEFIKLNTPASKKLIYRISALQDIKSGGDCIEWRDIIHNGRSVIIQLSDFNEPMKTLYTEMILSDLWNWVRKNNNRKELILILDEIQNLSFKSSAFMAKLREFRKFGIGAVMSTQFLGRSFDEDAKSFLHQSAVKIYFQPDDMNIKCVAQSIDRKDYKEWMEILRNLDRGECVFCGKTEIGNIIGHQNVIIKVPLV